MINRSTNRFAVLALLIGMSCPSLATSSETIYNGIVLPDVWPPRNLVAKGEEPLPVPYLEHRPAVAPIDVGRQLFVDDFLIEQTNLIRTYHRARKYEGNPILKAATDIERGLDDHVPAAIQFSDGIWYDGRDQLFKMWYHAGWFEGTAYATSRDGLHWERPDLNIEPGTNRVLPRRPKVKRDSSAVTFDPWAEDPAQRFKMLLFARSPANHSHNAAEVYVSADGIHWGEPTLTSPVGDRSTIFYNPFRKKWVYSVRSSVRGRSRHYREHSDFLVGARWSNDECVFWAAADKLDPPDPVIKNKAQLYNLDAVAYESLMIGAFAIHLGPENPVCSKGGYPKMNEIMLGFSRDGFHWHRPDRRAFINAERRKEAWDRGYLHSTSSVCVVNGDELWFYYTGFQGDESLRNLPLHADGMYANGSTGLAILRRDGFASMDAGEKTGTLTTRPVSFQGQRLFVNVKNPAGELRVEVLDQEGTPLVGFSAEQCEPLTVDSTLSEVRWRGIEDLSSLRGKPVRFRFHLTRGQLYAFWVSPDAHGASHGYLAAGSPGQEGLVDTRGREAKRK